MIRILKKTYNNEDFGVFRCISHKEKVVEDLFYPWTKKYPEFNYDYLITINRDTSNLVMIITNELNKLKEFKEKYDSERSSGDI